jgi:hypothetical protein
LLAFRSLTVGGSARLPGSGAGVGSGTTKGGTGGTIAVGPIPPTDDSTTGPAISIQSAGILSVVVVSDCDSYVSAGRPPIVSQVASSQENGPAIHSMDSLVDHAQVLLEIRANHANHGIDKCLRRMVFSFSDHPDTVEAAGSNPAPPIRIAVKVSYSSGTR